MMQLLFDDLTPAQQGAWAPSSAELVPAPARGRAGGRRGDDQGLAGHTHGAAGRGHAGAVRTGSGLEGRRMLYALVSFSDQIGPLNVFRYITFRTGGAIMTALLFVFLFGPAIIDLLRVKQGKGQPIREDGPQTHFAKSGTPTMGGLMILSGVTVSTLLWANLGQLVRVDRAVRDARLRRHRLLRRLSQGHQAAGPPASPASCGCWPRWSSPASPPGR